MSCLTAGPTSDGCTAVQAVRPSSCCARRCSDQAVLNGLRQIADEGPDRLARGGVDEIKLNSLHAVKQVSLDVESTAVFDVPTGLGLAQK
jgi:hypothetical protein